MGRRIGAVGEGGDGLGEGEVFPKSDHDAVPGKLFSRAGEHLAMAVGFDLAEVGEQSVQGAELLDPGGGGFRADAGEAGNVVHGVAGQGQDVSDAFGRDAPFGLDGGGVEELKAFGRRLVDGDAVADELHQIFVVRCQYGFDARALGGTGVAGQNIVGLLVLDAEVGEAEGRGELFDEGELEDEGRRGLGAVGFVIGLLFEAVGGEASVHDDGGKIGLQLGDHSFEGFGDAVEGIGRLAARVRQFPDGVERAVGVVVAVNEEESHGGRGSIVVGFSGCVKAA